MTAVEMLNELIAQGHVRTIPDATTDFVMPSAYIDVGSVTVYAAEIESVGDDAELDAGT